MKKREYAGRILLAAIAGVFLLLAAFKRFSVNVVLSGSMEPVIRVGDMILISNPVCDHAGDRRYYYVSYG